MSPRPTASAPPLVAIFSTVDADRTCGSMRSTFCSKRASRISSHMSRSLLLAAPSVPKPTRTPAASISATGEMPEAIFMFEVGLCMTPTFRLGQYWDLGLGRPDDVCGDGRAVKKTNRFIEFYAGHPEGVFRVLQFERRFGHVNTDADAVFCRRRPSGLQAAPRSACSSHAVQK